jgi:hypothetical protein
MEPPTNARVMGVDAFSIFECGIIFSLSEEVLLGFGKNDLFLFD